MFIEIVEEKLPHIIKDFKIQLSMTLIEHQTNMIIKAHQGISLLNCEIFRKKYRILKIGKTKKLPISKPTTIIAD